jgi:hypothetical protein
MADYKGKVAVVIPIYRHYINALEQISLDQCFKILRDYSIIIVKPESLKLPANLEDYKVTKVINFRDDFFESINGYNALMLADLFYKEFISYEYILIHQLDAFVFKDELNYWCKQGLDYIGAPWLRGIDHPDLAKKIKSNIKYFLHTRYNVMHNGQPTKYQFENKVGNGGFSLRRVHKFLQLCIEHKSLISDYLTKANMHYNEDRFWSIEVNRKRKALNIPGYKTGIKFSIEFAPQRAFKLNNNELPFGCHAWDKDLDFWRPVFKKYNYYI